MPDRPLDTWTAVGRQAAALGIDELTWFVNTAHKDSVGTFCIQQANEAAGIPNFEVSLAIGLPRSRLERDWLGPVKQWCNAAATNAGIAKVDGRAVVWTYQAGAFDLDEWRAFIGTLHAQGYHPYLIGDMWAYAVTQPEAFADTADQWAALFDALYMFGYHQFPVVTTMLEAVQGARASRKVYTPLIGTVAGTGGYWRWGNDHQSPRSQLYNGTGSYVEKWNAVYTNAVSFDWIHVTTWNDFLEHTMNKPTRNTGGVYGELLRIHGSRFKGVDLPRPPAYWITAPAELRNGPGGLNEYIYEVRATSPRGPAKVVVTFHDDGGHVVRTEAVELTPERDVFRFSWEPGTNEFGRAHYLTMDAEVVTQGQSYVGSLPIPVWPAGEERVFTKMPRTLRLLPPDRVPERPVVALTEDGALRVTPLPPAGNANERVDVLYDMHMKGRDGVNLGAAVTGPRQLPDQPPCDPYYFKRGFRQAAVVTRNGRVAWSRPLWVDRPVPMHAGAAGTDIDPAAVARRPFPAVRINFQNREATTPPGYIVDVGLPFGPRTNGLYYGWSRNVETFTRSRGLDDNVIYDTLIPLRYNLSSWSWMLALPNGRYRLRLGVGDAAFTTSWVLTLNDRTLTDPTPRRIGSDDVALDLVVTNHLLKLSVGDGENAPINYVAVTPRGDAE